MKTLWKPQAPAQECGQAQFLEALDEFGFVLWHLPSFLGLFLCFSLFSAPIPFSLYQVLVGQARGQLTPSEVPSEPEVQWHKLCSLISTRWKYQYPAGALFCSFSPCFCSLLPDLSSLTIPYDEEDEEELYNDVDSSDSVNTASHNTTLNQDDPNMEMEEDDIYEVLPGKQPKKQVKTRALPQPELCKRGRRPWPHHTLMGMNSKGSAEFNGTITQRFDPVPLFRLVDGPPEQTLSVLARQRVCKFR